MTAQGSLTLVGGGLIGNTSGAIGGGTLSGSPGGALIVVTPADLTIASVIADNAGATGLTKGGPATLTLAASNAYSGGTTINAGTLRLGNPRALGTGGLSISGGELDLNANSIGLPSLAGNGGTISDESVAGGTTTLTVGQAGNSTFGGTIRDGLSGRTIALALNGPGTLTLAGTNTYSGPTTLSAGLLVAGAVNALSASSDVTVSGGTLDVSGFANAVKSLSITGGALTLGLANDAPALLSISNAAALGGTIDVAATGTQSQGLYTLATYASRSGSFTQGAVPANYRLNATGSELDLVHLATVGLSVCGQSPQRPARQRGDRRVRVQRRSGQLRHGLLQPRRTGPERMSTASAAPAPRTAERVPACCSAPTPPWRVPTHSPSASPTPAQRLDECPGDRDDHPDRLCLRQPNAERRRGTRCSGSGGLRHRPFGCGESHGQSVDQQRADRPQRRLSGQPRRDRDDRQPEGDGQQLHGLGRRTKRFVDIDGGRLLGRPAGLECEPGVHQQCKRRERA